MKANAVAAEIASIRTRLSENAEIAACRYLDHLRSYEYGEKLFKSIDELAVFSALKPAGTPTMFLCGTKSSANAPSVAKLSPRSAGRLRRANPEVAANTDLGDR